jgi:DivIVA domain-containing protein
MDVTPQELRDIDIRESFRGYHRDEVDELLERAAATIEHLEHQIRILQERLAAGPGQPAPRPAPQPAPQAAPAPAPQPASTPIPVPDSDVIQRTLILAQKAADEAVADAQARASQLMSESEAKAQALVSEAESTARRIAESERRRIEAEIAQLSTTRDALSSDVDALEKFAAEYRDRIRASVEAELAYLSTVKTDDEPAPVRPALQTEGMTFAGASASAPAAAAPSEPAPQTARDVDPSTPDPEPTMSVEAVAAETPSWNSSESSESAWSPEPAGGWSEAENTGQTSIDELSSAELSRESAQEDYGSDSLDDDAFFASLRDAVRDDEPLGPRDDAFYDEDDTDSGKKLFRRRR